VKPHNILLCGDRPKLGDFGLVRNEAPEELTRLTADGTTLGTLPYLAPELFAGGAPSVASDVYALGVTTYQALTGELPRPVGSLREMIEGRLVVPPAASVAAARLGDVFDAPLASALNADPAKRPAPQGFAARLSEALGAWSEGQRSRPHDAAKTAAFAIASLPPPDPAPVEATETIVMPTPAPSEPDPEPEPAVEATVAPPPVATPAIRIPRLALDARSRRALALAGAAVIGMAAFVLVAAVVGRALDTSTWFDVDALGAAGPSGSTAASPSPAASADASADPAIAAVNNVLAAIDAARGGRDGLKGNEANELTSLVGQVRSALESGETDEAREAAAKLDDRAGKLSKGLDKERRDRLLGAIEALRSAIPGED
jgi:hypothetical protein